MITYGPAISPAACHRKLGSRVGSPGLLRGGAIIRIPVVLSEAIDRDEKTLWLDFEAKDRDALHQLATDILKALAEPMGGA